MKKTDAENHMIGRFNEMLSLARLDEILEALSKGCMAHCKDMLNAEMTEDTNGNTLKALFDFSDRLHRLARSSRSHNKQAPIMAREMKGWSKDDRIKGVSSKDIVYRDRDYKPSKAAVPDDDIE